MYNYGDSVLFFIERMYKHTRLSTSDALKLIELNEAKSKFML